MVSGFAKLPTAFTSQQKGRKRRRLALSPFFEKMGAGALILAGKRVFERKFVFSSDFLRKLAISGSGGPISGSGSGFWLENVFLSDFLV